MVKVFLSILGIAGIWIFLVLPFTGCQRNDGKAGSQEDGQWHNDLVALKIRRLERPDRIVPSISMPLASSGANVQIKDASPNWRSERLSKLALDELTAVFKSGVKRQGAFAENFRASQALPDRLEMTAKTVSGITEWRPASDPKWLNGEQFTDSVNRLIARFPLRSKLKLTSVRVVSGKLEAEVIAVHVGKGVQATVRWAGVWEISQGDGLGLVELDMRDYVELRSTSKPLYVDSTEEVMGDIPHFHPQVTTSIAQWAGTITGLSDMALTGHHGVAVGDVDGDGREDLFVCDGGGLPNRLYRQCPDGSVEDISRYSGVDWLEDSRAALLVDIDNDGDQDLVVATIAMVVFAENDGRARFTVRGGFSGAQYPFSLSAADYDLDGNLDVYICVYGEGDADSAGRGFASRIPVPFDDAQNGGSNVLLKNLGKFAFADVTDDVGLQSKNNRWSFAASWEDFDRDGDVDLYVANDFGRNCLYKNNGGEFNEIGEWARVEDTAAGMSVSWGDYNRDGRFDLYVGNMFSAAGRRVSLQDEFAPGRNVSAIMGLRRMAIGNTLFAGVDGGFNEVPDAGGSVMSRWAWSSGFVDIDNDGWEDVVVANGYLTGWALKDDL